MLSLAVLIFFCAMSVLGLEVIWMRLFAVESFSSFGYMILSIALLGFGVGGVVVARLTPKLNGLRDNLLFACACLYPISVATAIIITRQIPFIPQEIISNSSQWLYIATYYAVLAVPFFMGSMIIGVILTSAGEKVGRLYFADLVGSGIGGLASLAGFYLIRPNYLPLAVILLFMPGLAVTAWRGSSLPRPWRIGVAGLAALVAVGLMVKFDELKVSEYKGISYAMMSSSVTGAEVIKEAYSPLGFIQVVESTSERSAPGLSTNSPMEAIPPVQPGIYIDGNKIAAMSVDMPDDERVYMDWMMTSIPYQVKKNPRVLLIGLGGGEGVVQALRFGAREVVVADIDRVLVSLVAEWASSRNNGLLSRPEVKIQVADGRDVARRNPGGFDLVMLNFMDASGLSLAGSKSTSENYLYTVEAFGDFLGALAPDGILVSFTPMQNPPMAALRTIPALVKAADGFCDRKQLSASMVYLKTDLNGMALVRRGPFTPEELDTLLFEAENMDFQQSYFPGRTRSDLEQEALEEEEAWREIGRQNNLDLSGLESDEQAQDPFFDYLSAAFEDPDGGSGYISDYPFNIEPTYDDKPYFTAIVKTGTFDFVKSSAYNPEAWTKEIHPDLWFQPLVWVTLLQASIFAMLTVLVAFLLSRKSLPRSGKLPTLVYFICLAVGYMFIEIVLIQKLTHYVSAPAYSAAVVLTGMLIFSGIGSLFSSKFVDGTTKGITIAFIGIAAFVILYRLFLDPILHATISSSETLKIVLAILLIGPVAFFMGMPFPLGMSSVAAAGQSSLGGFGWAVNGAVSVIGVVLAQTLAMEIGFSNVIWIALLTYGLAWIVFPGRFVGTNQAGSVSAPSSQAVDKMAAPQTKPSSD